jgi:hypothetical protein
MAGGIVFVLAMVIAVPVGVMFAGAAWSALVGWLASENTEPTSDAAASTSDG